MYIPWVLFPFLEAALKRRPRAIEAEIKQLMPAKLKMHLAVCMVVAERWSRKWLFGKRMLYFEFTVMRASYYKEQLYVLNLI